MTALYVRSRRLPIALATSLAAIVVIGVLWVTITHRLEVDPSLAVLTVLLALVPLIPTLVSDDDALEKTTARPGPAWRVAHLLTGGALITAVLAGARLTGLVGFGPTGQILRDSAGLTGLIGLSSALLGPRMAWAPPVAWSMMQVLVTPETGGRRALFWLVQPVHDSAALVTALVLLAGGVVAYAWRPAPPTMATE